MYLFTKNCFCVLLFTSLISSSIHAQSSTISGTVTDESGNPIELVNVYITNTTIGASTDESGTFEFTTTLTGNRDIIFSRVGYEPVRRSVQLGESQRSFQFSVSLKEAEYELGEIGVISDNREWRRNYESFKQEFLGTSLFASETEIKNPWVIDFETNRNRELIASANEPLEIVNMALGYNIYVDLDEYNWNRDLSTGFFRMDVRYEELTSNNEIVQNRWEENRKRAYQGSFEHFLNSIYEDNLLRNGFEPVRPSSSNRERIRRLNDEDLTFELMKRRSFNADRLENYRGFTLRRGRADILIGQREYRTDNRDRAIIVANYASNVFIVTQERTLMDPMELSVDGIWKSHRLADKVPVDYYFDQE